MPVTIDVSGDEQLRKLVDQFPKEATKALNETAERTKNAAVREVTEIYNIKRSDVNTRSRIRVSRATQSNMVAQIVPTGKATPLVLFAGNTASNLKLARSGGRKGVGASARVFRTAGRSVYPHTFLATLKSGHVGIFKRTGERAPGSAREKIKEEFRVSVANMIGSKKVFEKVQDFATKTLPERVEYWVGRIFK